MKKTTIIALLAFAVLGIAGIGSAAAFGMGYLGTTADKTAIKTAIDNNDFTAWKSAVEATLTQDNFNKIVAGNNAQTDRMNMMNNVKSAIEANDYNAYVKAMNIISNANVASQSDFDSCKKS
jgi:hypothetical protein